jgi:hypothetical protein
MEGCQFDDVRERHQRQGLATMQNTRLKVSVVTRRN